MPRTSRDPAWDHEDFEAEARLAVLQGRPEHHSRAIAKNKERDVTRRRGALYRLIQKMPSRSNTPSHTIDDHDLLLQGLRRLAKEHQAALLAELMRATGFSCIEVASILGCRPEHVSRLRRQAQEEVAHFDQ